MTGKNWAVIAILVTAILGFLALGFEAMSTNSHFVVPHWVPPLFFALACLSFLALVIYVAWIRVWHSKTGQEDTKTHVKILEDIKTDLIILDKYQRDVAIKKAQQPWPNGITHIYDGIAALFPISTLIFVIQATIHEKIDPILEFLQKFGEVLDANECGLEVELKNNECYQSAKVDLAQKRVTLHTTKKKKAFIQTNTNRICTLTYGLNSLISLRETLRIIPQKNESANLGVLRIVLIGLQGIGNQLEKLLADGLDHLDKEWTPKLGIKPSDIPLLQALLDQLLELNDEE